MHMRTMRLKVFVFILLSMLPCGFSAYAANLVVGKTAEPSTPDFFLTSNYASDAACIQAALNASVSGDTITIRAESYSISQQMTHGRDITVIGEGTVIFNIDAGESNSAFSIRGSNLKTTALAADSAVGAETVTLQDASGIAGGDLILIYNSILWCPDDYPAHLTGETYTVKSVAGNTVTLETRLIRDYTAALNSRAIIYRPVKVNIRNISFIGIGSAARVRALTLTYCRDVSVTDCYFRDNGQAAIYLYTCGNVDIGNNVILNSNMAGYGYGVAVVDASANVRIHDNTIRNCRHDITSGNAGDYGVNRDVYIYNNTLYNDDGLSAVIDAHPSTLNYIVTGNTIYADDQISFADGTVFSVFSNNTIYNGTGIGKRGNINGTIKVISGNTIEDGTFFYDNDPFDVREMYVLDNHASGTSANYFIDILYLNAGKLVVSGNTVSGMNYPLLLNVSAAKSFDIIVSSNTFSDSYRDAVTLQYGAGSTGAVHICNNKLQNTGTRAAGYNGIVLNGVQNAVVYGNSITDTGGKTAYGIYENSSCDHNSIYDNTSSGLSGGTAYIQSPHPGPDLGPCFDADPAFHALTVLNGDGSGAYTAGQTVTASANAPRFARWTGDVSCVSNVNSYSTQVTMPDTMVNIAATYSSTVTPSDPYYSLTVNQGSGTGYYFAGQRVMITANTAATGKVFDAWTGDTLYVDHVTSAAATVIMPARGITLTAAYRLAGSGPDPDPDPDPGSDPVDGQITVHVGEIKIVGSSQGRGTVNPDNGETVKIFYKGAERGNYKLRVFTSDGRLVWEATQGGADEGMFEWHPRNIASGIYIASVKGPGFSARKKIAIVR